MLTSNVIMLTVSLFLYSSVLSTPQVHRLCFLQIWGKRARGGRSIQARHSEWPMTVQYSRKLRKKIKHIIILLHNLNFHFLSPLYSLRQNMTASCSGSRDKGSDCLAWRIWHHNKNFQEKNCLFHMLDINILQPTLMEW